VPGVRFACGTLNPARSLPSSPDGKLLGAGHNQQNKGPGTVRIWDLATAKEVRALPVHAAEVASVAFSPDGKTVLSSSFDSELRLWDVATCKELKRFASGKQHMECAVFTSDGCRILSCGDQPSTVRHAGLHLNHPAAARLYPIS
jgi:WD40 repeat protein